MNEDPRLGSPLAGGARPPSLLARALAFVAGAVVLGAALFFSVIVFAVLAVVGVIAGAWLWWHTREVRGQLRAQMREAQRAAQSQTAREGEVIEGDYIREARRPSQSDAQPGAGAGTQREPGRDPPQGPTQRR